MNDEMVKPEGDEAKPGDDSSDIYNPAPSTKPSTLLTEVSDDLQEQDSGGDPTMLSLPVVPSAQPAPSLAQTASRAMVWNTLLFPLKFVVSIASSVILFNLLSVDEYGLVAFVSSIASTIGLYADLGIERSLPRFVPEVERSGGPTLVRSFLWQIVALKMAVMALLVGALLIFSGPLLAWLSLNQKAGIITLLTQLGSLVIFTVSAMLVLGALFDTFMQFLLSYFKQRAWNIITIAATMLQPALIILFFSIGEGKVEFVLIAMMITPFVSVLLAGRQALRLASSEAALRAGGATAIGRVGSLPPDFRTRFLRYSGISYFMNISVYFYTLPFANIIINSFYRLNGVGLFSAAYNFVNQVLAVLWAPLSGLQVPLFSRIYAQDKEKAGGTLPIGAQASAQLQESYTLLSKFLALILIPAGIGLALLTTNLIYVLYSKDGSASLTAVVLVIFLFAEAAISIPHNILMVYERFKPVLWSRAISLISIPLLPLFIQLFAAGAQTMLHLQPDDAKPFGLVGAAAAVGLARILSRLVVFVYARRSMGLRYPWIFARKVALASVAMAVVVRLLAVWVGHYPFGATSSGKVGAALLDLATAMLGGAVFAVTFKLLGGLDEDDKRRLARLKLPLPPWVLRWL